MYFITTKRMLEVCFSAHPNIQYRTFLCNGKIQLLRRLLHTSNCRVNYMLHQNTGCDGPDSARNRCDSLHYRLHRRKIRITAYLSVRSGVYADIDDNLARPYMFRTYQAGAAGG